MVINALRRTVRRRAGLYQRRAHEVRAVPDGREAGGRGQRGQLGPCGRRAPDRTWWYRSVVVIPIVRGAIGARAPRQYRALQIGIFAEAVVRTWHATEAGEWRRQIGSASSRVGEEGIVSAGSSL